MYVMGGGRTAPNPSNEVDVYDPVVIAGQLARRSPTARRNFPTDTDGTNHIWLAGGYDSNGVTLLASMEIFDCPVSPCGSPSPTPTATTTATATPTSTPQTYSDSKRSSYAAPASHTCASAVTPPSVTLLYPGTREAIRESLLFYLRALCLKALANSPSLIDRTVPSTSSVAGPTETDPWKSVGIISASHLASGSPSRICRRGKICSDHEQEI